MVDKKQAESLHDIWSIWYMHCDEIYIAWKIEFARYIKYLKVCILMKYMLHENNTIVNHLGINGCQDKSVQEADNIYCYCYVSSSRPVFHQQCFDIARSLIFDLAFTCFRSIYLWIIRNLLWLQMNVQFHKTGASGYIIGKVADQSYDLPHLQPSKAQVNSTHT